MKVFKKILRFVFCFFFFGIPFVFFLFICYLIHSVFGGF